MVIGLHHRGKKQRPQDDGDFHPEQFEKISKEPRIPVKAIALAIFLLTAGTFCLVLSTFGNVIPSDSFGTLFTLGLLMFIPGYYHVRIAYFAYRGCPGYSYEDLPDFE